MTWRKLCAAFRYPLALIALASSAHAQFKDAAQFGFLPENDGFKNAEALQKAVDGGGTIAVSKKGVYAISKEIRIGDNTHLVFGADTVVKKDGGKGRVLHLRFRQQGRVRQNVQ